MQDIMEERIYLWSSIHTPAPIQREYLERTGKLLFLSELNEALQERLNSTPIEGVKLLKLAEDLLEFASSLRENKDDPQTYIVQPGGSPAFQAMLGEVNTSPRYNQDHVCWLMYSHSVLKSEDVPQADGTVKKVSELYHMGWTTV